MRDLHVSKLQLGVKQTISKLGERRVCSLLSFRQLLTMTTGPLEVRICT